MAAKIKGKQIYEKTVTAKQLADASVTSDKLIDGSVSQRKLNINDPVIDSDASTKKYTDNLVTSSISTERITDKNQGMTAEDTSIGVTSGISLACTTPILEDSVVNSTVEVYINGIKTEVGDGKSCFFSPDGEIIRKVNDVRIGDKLFWDSANASYELDNSDKIDFKYLTNNKQIKESILEEDNTYIVESDVTLLKYTGIKNNSKSAYIAIEDKIFRVTYTFVSTDWFFTFDFSGNQEYIFTEIDDVVDIVVNSNVYSIRWSGIGSTIITISKHGVTDNEYGPLGIDLASIIDDNISSYYFSQVKSCGDWLITRSATELLILKRVNNTWVFHQKIDYSGIGSSPDIANAHFDTSGSDARFCVKISGNSDLSILDYDDSSDLWSITQIITIPLNSVYYLNGDKIFLGNISYNIPISNVGRIHVWTYVSETWSFDSYIDYPGTADITGLNFGRLMTVDGNSMLVSTSRELYYTDIDTINFVECNILPEYDYSNDIYINIDNHMKILNDICVINNSNNKSLSFFERNGTTFDHISSINFIDFATNEYSESDKQSFIINNMNEVYVSTFQNASDKSSIKLAHTYIFENINGEWLSTGVLAKPTYEDGYSLGNTDYNNTYLTYNKTANLEFASTSHNNKKIYEYGGSFIYNYPADRIVKPIASMLTLVEDIPNDKYTVSYEYSHPTGIKENLPVVNWRISDYFFKFESLPSVVSNNVSKPIEDITGKVVDYSLCPVDINNIKGDKSNSLLEEGIIQADDDNSEFTTLNNGNGPMIKLTIISGNLAGTGPGVYNLRAENYTQDSINSTIGLFNDSSGLSMSINMKVRPSASQTTRIFWLSDGSTSTSVVTSSGLSDFKDIDYLFKTYTVGDCTFTIEKLYGWCPLQKIDR